MMSGVVLLTSTILSIIEMIHGETITAPSNVQMKFRSSLIHLKTIQAPSELACIAYCKNSLDRLERGHCKGVQYEHGSRMCHFKDVDESQVPAGETDSVWMVDQSYGE